MRSSLFMEYEMRKLNESTKYESYEIPCRASDPQQNEAKPVP
jgi:hypothetical protein